jgi:hypothetical protein
MSVPWAGHVGPVTAANTDGRGPPTAVGRRTAEDPVLPRWPLWFCRARVRWHRGSMARTLASMPIRTGRFRWSWLLFGGADLIRCYSSDRILWFHM